MFRESEGIKGSYTITGRTSILQFEGKSAVHADYHPGNKLPTTNAVNYHLMTPQVNNVSVLDKENQKLTSSQKLLLQWHYCFGHHGLQAIQRLLCAAPFGHLKVASASKCDIPKCDVCEFAKAHRHHIDSKTSKPVAPTEGALKVNDLRPGANISADHFESRLKGRTYTSFWKDYL